MTEQELINILKEYNLGEAKEIKKISTSGNITFLIKINSEKYIFRLCPEGFRWRSKEEILAELELINYLNKNDFPAPYPIVKKNSDIIIEYKNKFGYLCKHNSGKEILNPNIKQIIEFGKTLGWFHFLVDNYKTKNKREHIWDLETTQNNFLEIRDFILKSNFPKANDFVKKFEKEIFDLSFPKELPQGMIHEDLGKRHVLWQSNKISGILDFDRCYYGKLILDLGQAIRGWCFIDDWKKWSNQNFKALISGYFQKRKLSDLEKEYLFDAIKFGILERGLSFCLRFIQVTQNKDDCEFAHQSVFKLIDLLDKNKEEFVKILE